MRMVEREARRDVDQHVGRRMRMRRKQLRISQQRLAARLNISFQQIQKYEKGANRISASVLYEAAEALAMPVEAFFEGLPKPGGAPVHAPSRDVLTQMLAAPGGVELAEAFLAVSRPALRRPLVTIACELAELELTAGRSQS